jgi:hypothetical protein
MHRDPHTVNVDFTEASAKSLPTRADESTVIET